MQNQRLMQGKSCIRIGLVGAALAACTSPLEPFEDGTGESHTLVVIIDGAGAGEVRVKDSNVACATDCEQVYDTVNELVLEAAPGATSTFESWGGDCSGTGDCTVMLSGFRQVVATFARKNVEDDGGEPVELTATVAGSSDDTMYDPYTTSMLIDGSWCSMYSPDHPVGLRFALDLPRDATILDAYLEVYVDSPEEDSPDADFFVEDVDDAVAFDDVNGDLLGRIPSTPLAEWKSSDIGTGWQKSPSMAALVQQWADRPGRPTTGGHIMIMGRQRTSDDAFEFRQWDNEAGTFAARLHVVYE